MPECLQLSKSYREGEGSAPLPLRGSQKDSGPAKYQTPNIKYRLPDPGDLYFPRSPHASR
jgi:hypothetical protein